MWCQDNYLSLTVCKTREIIVDYRKRRAEHAPIHIDRAVMEWTNSLKFLGLEITNKLSWSKYTKTVMKRARQNLFPPRRLKRFSMGPQKVLKSFYSCTIESILTSCFTFWYDNCSASDQYITGAKLPAIQDLYIKRCQRKVQKIESPKLDCLLCCRTASSTKVPSLGPKGSSTAFTPSH